MTLASDYKTSEPNDVETEWSFIEEKIKPASYYVRVTRQDGEVAWSSPIWVET